MKRRLLTTSGHVTEESGPSAPQWLLAMSVAKRSTAAVVSGRNLSCASVHSSTETSNSHSVGPPCASLTSIPMGRPSGVASSLRR